MLFHDFPKFGNCLSCRLRARNGLQDVFFRQTEGMGVGEEFAGLMALGFAEWMVGEDGTDKLGYPRGRLYFVGKLFKLVNQGKD